MAKESEKLKLEMTRIQVTLEGLSDLVFDRFYDHSAEKRPPEQKLYLSEGNAVVMPGMNIESFLFRQLPPMGCAMSFEGKQGKTYRAVGTAHVMVEQDMIPITREGKPVIFSAFGKDGFYVKHGSGLTKGSGGNVIKQEDNPRPALSLPWSISFSLLLVKNNTINEAKLYNWFVLGGIQIGLGNWRPRHGRFAVTGWEIE